MKIIISEKDLILFVTKITKEIPGFTKYKEQYKLNDTQKQYFILLNVGFVKKHMKNVKWK